MYVVVATLNGLEYTQRLLASLGQVQTPLHVVVVDNGSTDGTPEWLGMQRGVENDQEVPLTARGLTLINHSGNTGASAAWNIGIRIALLNAADKIIVCGNDTIPMPGTVERLAALLDEGIPFVTGTAVPYDKPDVFCAPALPHEPLLNAPDFSFFMFKPAVVEMVARFDENLEFAVINQMKGQRPPELCKPWDWGVFDERMFPAFFEDNDYHLRMQKAGLVALRDSGAEFRHATSLTIRINPELGKLNQQTFQRNAELFKAKWGGLPHEVESVPGNNQRPIGARPLNVTDEQWLAMTGGHPVQELPRDQVIAQAQSVYVQHGIQV